MWRWVGLKIYKHDGKFSQLYYFYFILDWSKTDLTCWESNQLVQVSCKHCANSRSRKGTV